MSTKLVIFCYSSALTLGVLPGGRPFFYKIIHKTNFYPPIEIIFYESILHALRRKVVARSCFKIELRSILLSVKVWPARLPMLRHLLFNMNIRMEYLLISSSSRASHILVEYTVISNHFTDFSVRNGELSLK